jgi:hypothetical protein
LRTSAQEAAQLRGDSQLFSNVSGSANVADGSQADILRDELVETEVHLATVRVAEPPAVPCQVEDVSYSGFLPKADL